MHLLAITQQSYRSFQLTSTALLRQLSSTGCTLNGK